MFKTNLKVYDEDTHIKNMEKIIVKDFFPDLPKIKAQVEFLEAVETKDAAKISQIQQKYSLKRTTTPSIYATPSTFETPEKSLKNTPLPESGETETESIKEDLTRNLEPEEAKNAELMKLSLDKYLSKNTSEDNISFKELMAESDKKHRINHDWLYNPKLMAIENDGIKRLDMWDFVPHNAVMYIPDGAELTKEERLALCVDQPRIIVHENTRLHAPLSDPLNHNIDKVAAARHARLEGKVGPDGKEILPSQTPSVLGYKFLATPSPAPGIGASPLMTWGEIEGTPFRLDGGDTPLVASGAGPVFKIPDVPKRDQLALALAERASKNHRAKKQEALKQAAATFATPHLRCSSKSDRLLNLSPAAQRLVAKKFGLKVDSALKASYTPSPTRTSVRSKDATPSPRSLRGLKTLKEPKSQNQSD